MHPAISGIQALRREQGLPEFEMERLQATMDTLEQIAPAVSLDRLGANSPIEDSLVVLVFDNSEILTILTAKEKHKHPILNGLTPEVKKHRSEAHALVKATLVEKAATAAFILRHDKALLNDLKVTLVNSRPSQLQDVLQKMSTPICAQPVPMDFD